MVDVGPSELCNNCQGSLSRQVTELLRSSLSLANAKLVVNTDGPLSNEDSKDVSDKRSEGGGRYLVVPVEPTHSSLEGGEECLDDVEAKPIQSAGDNVLTNKADGNLAEDSYDDDDELLQAFVNEESGSTVEVKELVNQFWACSLCAAKNLEGTVECMACGIRRGDD